MEKSLFEQISIRGRMAYGITCLENLCETWNIKNEKMNLLIECLWTFTLSVHLVKWDEEIHSLLPDNDEIETYANEFKYDNLNSVQQKVLSNTIWDVIEIGQGNLYGAFNSKFSLLPLMVVIETLEKQNIELPEITQFEKSKVSEHNGWGLPVDKSYLK